MFKGTFFDDELTGIVACEIAIMRRTLAGEVKSGVLFGKMTMNRRGNRMNYLMDGTEKVRGFCKACKQASDTEAFYKDNGNPLKALDVQFAQVHMKKEEIEEIN